ncbi:MAG: succinyl-CoA synthetase (ADP-forming) beta subunit [Armatimonadetes bacterium]|nr:succinyl-CoA synthetase (ADP-forming) beta subunit [Armatimonadota bacterium]
MKIHEYQAKEVLRRYGVPTPAGEVAETPEQARAIAERLGGNLVVVKAQIHAGGRGKGGGVKLARSADEAEKAAGEILGMQLITHQTGPQGQEVRKVYIEAGSDIAKEYYLGLLLDRETSRNVIMASSEGGVEIEKVAEETPEKILKVWIDPAVGYQAYQGRQLAFGLGLDKAIIGKFVKFVGQFYDAYVKTDCSLAEINPLVVTSQGDVIALDAKINLDDNALFRHKDLAAYRDPFEETPQEREAHDYGINYISLDGNIACMVNGAGLAMSTMDIIKLHGGEPANFLDVGGGASEEQVTDAFRLLTSDPNVKAILVNIFGGIMKCDIIANGIVNAAKKLELKIPLVVRLQGTNVELGKKILSESGLAIIPADKLTEAAQKVVEAANAA